MVNTTGNLNKSDRKVSSTYNFVKHLVVGIILFLASLFLFFVAFPLGIFLFIISILLLGSAIYQKRRTNLFLKLQDELMKSLSDEEKVSYFFTDINSQGELSDGGIKKEKENVMILTERRVIILYVSRIEYGDLAGENALKNIGRGLSYVGLRKKN